MVPSKKFTTTSPVVASFDFSDIASGTGYENYYPMSRENTSGITYNLTSQQIYSADNYRDVVRSGSSEVEFTKDRDDDFDLTEFKFAKTASGVMSINIPYIYESDSAVNPNSFYFVVRLRKWDGTTETEVASVQTETVDSIATTAAYDLFSCGVDVPKTHFRVGDILRVTIEVWTEFTGAFQQLSIAYGISPNNQASEYLTTEFETTQSLVQVPFDLEQ